MSREPEKLPIPLDGPACMSAVAWTNIYLSVADSFDDVCNNVCDQMKCLIRKKLAPGLCMTVPSETTTPSAADNNDAGDSQQDEQQQLQDMTLGTTDKLLMEILRQLLLMRTGSKADDPDEENKNDWKLAAAVIDRILCIIFSILFLGGTIVFFVNFSIRHLPTPDNNV